MEYKHILDSKGTCEDCWSDQFPMKCKCGGLIHAEFFDTDIEDNYTLAYQCDTCGDEYEFKDDEGL